MKTRRSFFAAIGAAAAGAGACAALPPAALPTSALPTSGVAIARAALPELFPASPYTYDLIRDAYIQIGTLLPGEELMPAEMNYGYRLLNRLAEEWSTTRAIIPMSREVVSSLAAELMPHYGAPVGPPTMVFDPPLVLESKRSKLFDPPLVLG